LMLPHTAQGMTTAARLELHLSLATVVVVGYLAGSFADAQRQARLDVERRDRLLFQAERLKTLRAMSVAVIHEVSQPLSTLAIEAKHLHAITGISDPEIAQSAALIDRKAATLSHLVRRLRGYGGRVVDEPTPLPVSALIESVAALVAPEAKNRGITLKVAPVDPDLVVLAQEVELAQAVVNLLRNAIQASAGGGPGGSIQLRTGRQGRELRLWVVDSGKGVGEAEAVHLFDPFYCGRQAGRGLGLGLPRAARIVERAGGALTWTSSPGQGSVFQVRIPWERPPEEAAARSA